MTVPYTFGTATSSIPLSQLDTNFNTPITLGNTAVYLGNTTTTLNALTLSNVTISSGNVTITGVTVANVNVTSTLTLSGLTASTALALDASKNVVSVTNTGTGNNVLATSPTLVTPVLGTPTSVTLTNATGLPLSSGVTGTLPTTNGGTGLTSFTANGVVYASSSSALATGSALTFDGTNLGVGKTGATPLDMVGTFRWSSNVGGTDVWQRFSGGTGLIYDGTTTATDLAWIRNGGEGMRLTSTGLGIGTSSPSAKLEIVGNQKITGYIELRSANKIYFDDATNSSSGAIWNNASGTSALSFTGNGSTEHMRLDSSGNLGLGVTPSAWGSTNGGAFQFGSGYSSLYSYSNAVTLGSNVYYNAGNKYFASGVGSSAYQQLNGVHYWLQAPSGTAGNAITFTQAMTLASTGNLLLGSTTAPSGFSRISLVGGESSGTGANSGVQFTYNASTYGGGAITTVSAAGGGMSFYTFTGNVGSEAYTERARIDSSGNLAIGATAALGSTSKVFVKASSEPTAIGNPGTLTLQRSANDSFLGIGYFSTPDAWVIEASYSSTGAYKPIVFATSDTERMRLDTSGRLLIGTSSLPSSTVAGLQLTGTGGGQISSSGSSTTTYNHWIFQNGNGTVGSISTNGTATTYATSSDYRLKNNQAPLTGSGAFIDALQPKTWEWAQDGSKGAGFIAHEFAEVSPSSVVGEKDAVDAEGNPVYQAMQASSPEVIANLVAEIQSLRKRLAALEAK